MSSLLYRLGLFVARRARWVIGAWLVLVLAAGGLAATVGGQLEDDFSIPGTEGQEGLETLETRFPQSSGATAQLIYGAPEGERIDDSLRADLLTQTLDDVRALDNVGSVDDPFESETSISDDGRYALVTVQYEVLSSEITAEDRDLLIEAAQPRGDLEMTYGGSLFTTRGAGLSLVEAIGLLVAFMVLFVLFRSFLAAGLPLVMTLVAVFVGFAAITVVAGLMPVSTTTPSLAVMLGLAVGIDYGLFILSRHRSELSHGVSVPEAIARSLATAGSAVVFAGATVVIALAALTIPGIPFLAIMGLAAAGTVAMAVISTLTLFPAMLALFGERLRPRAPRREKSPNSGRLGRMWIAVTKRHPIMTIAVSSGLLLLLLIPAADMRFALNDNGTAEEGTPVRESFDLIADVFGPGFNAPLVVTADIITSTDPLQTVEDITAELEGIPGVDVVSRATPNPGADLAIFRVIPEGAQTDLSTIALVDEIRDQSSSIEEQYGVDDVLVTGATAVSIDASERLAAAIVPFAVVVLGLSFVLSLLVFRSIAIPIKATIGFALSTAAAFGVVSAVYSWGWFADLFHAQAPQPIVSFFPIMVIGILFGLSMDYEVFLVSRIREEYVRTGDTEFAIDEGYRHSQAVVNAAGIIMIAVFVAFIPHGSATVKPLALGLAVGVFVDAFIVRMSLARAILYVLGPRAWWLPRWLERRLPHLDVEGESLERDLEARRDAEAPGAIPLAIELSTPPLSLVVGENMRWVQPDPLVRASVAAQVAGVAVPAEGARVLGRALPAGGAAVRRSVVRMSDRPFADAAPATVDSVGVVRRWMLARGLPGVSTRGAHEILDKASIARDRSLWTDLDRHRLDIALAEAVGARLIVADDPGRRLPPDQAEALERALTNSRVESVLIMVPSVHPTHDGDGELSSVTLERNVSR